MTAPFADTTDSWDPIHSVSHPTSVWSTSNFGEAMPGVNSPLGWSIWGPGGEAAVREGFYRMGALSRLERLVPGDPLELVINIFYGRVAGRVDFLFEVGNRLPGTSGPDVARQIVGAAPESLVSRPTRRRYPMIAARFPATFLTIAGEVQKAARETSDWWSAGIAAVQAMSDCEAINLFIDARRRFVRNVALQGAHVLCAVQTTYELMGKLVATAGFDDVNEFMSGFGPHAESAVVYDLWLAAQGRLPFDEVLRRHGYHGPREGEISSTVWREDDTPLRRLLDSYKHKPDPADVEAERCQHRDALERDLLARLPASRRPYAKLVLRLARKHIPMRGVAKSAFLQSLDMARAGARRIGEHLALACILDDREDVFFLTADEIAGDLPPDARSLVTHRRARFDDYLKLDIPSAWQGTPAPVQLEPVEPQPTIGIIEGVGASPGVVEGRVRVVTDPATDDVEPGEILVAPFTDPSWAALMYVSRALVVDIGGALSHAAIVARELDLPCVVNTGDGTRRLRTGDVCRVDGGHGRVEIVQRPTGPFVDLEASRAPAHLPADDR